MDIRRSSVVLQVKGKPNPHPDVDIKHIAAQRGLHPPGSAMSSDQNIPLEHQIRTSEQQNIRSEHQIRTSHQNIRSEHMNRTSEHQIRTSEQTFRPNNQSPEVLQVDKLITMPSILPKDTNTSQYHKHKPKSNWIKFNR